MSILIHGMKMPTSCRDCRFCNGQADTDYGVCAWCDVDGNARDAYTMQNCPLVPVPPHGRLGDLDALAAKDNADYEDAMASIADVSTRSIVCQIHDGVQKMIAEAETIIPADPEKEDT